MVAGAGAPNAVDPPKALEAAGAPNELPPKGEAAVVVGVAPKDPKPVLCGAGEPKPPKVEAAGAPNALVAAGAPPWACEFMSLKRSSSNETSRNPGLAVKARMEQPSFTVVEWVWPMVVGPVGVAVAPKPTVVPPPNAFCEGEGAPKPVVDDPKGEEAAGAPKALVVVAGVPKAF